MTKPTRDPMFKQRHFNDEIILLCVRWYVSYKLSYRDLAVDGVPNPRHSGGASKVGIHYADADVSLFFLADAFLFYQHHSAR